MATPERVATGDYVQAHNFAIFLNGGSSTVPDWVFIDTSTNNDIAMNANTTEKKFTSKQTPTNILNYYAPSLSHPITMKKGDAAYEMVKELYQDLEVGGNALTDILVVFYESEVTSTSFKAWKAETTLIFGSITTGDSTITVNTALADVKKGTVEMATGTPVFTGTTQEEVTLTVTVKDGSTATSGATVIVDGVEKVTGTGGTATFTVLDGAVLPVGAVKSTKTGAVLIEIDGDTALEIGIAVDSN